ncbi:competence type IV pilus minor pilin ComGG, partial [Mycobacterium tuberculosis]
VKAGVLLYAITIASIFSLLFQFYLNRQQAHYQDYVLNKEKLLAFAMAKRTYEKAISDSGNQSFNMGEVMYHNEEKGFVARVTTDKNYYESHLP